ncbi:hypothetical protein [Serinicoccus sp. CNJ-927]|uniref:hypothetical protein n=1 Tax=Serinicoccus sp. CNJ-927 TaxID=1904970 RepID=UPI00117B240B|nr:hypothetical protein [Serinicoccus sp. CNJ-927]
MTWMRSRMGWFAAVISLWALLRALRRLVEPDDRPVALAVAVVVILVAALIPPARGSGRVTAEQAGWRKVVQLFLAAGVTALAALVGAGVLVAGVLGVVTAAVVPLAWPAPRESS